MLPLQSEYSCLPNINNCQRPCSDEIIILTRTWFTNIVSCSCRYIVYRVARTSVVSMCFGINRCRLRVTVRTFCGNIAHRISLGLVDTAYLIFRVGGICWLDERVTFGRHWGLQLVVMATIRFRIRSWVLHRNVLQIQRVHYELPIIHSDPKYYLSITAYLCKSRDSSLDPVRGSYSNTALRDLSLKHCSGGSSNVKVRMYTGFWVL